MPATGFSGTVRATVLAFEIEKMLCVSWGDADSAAGNDADWTITWTLESEGTGTRLFLVHEGFDPDQPAQLRARTTMGQGWRSTVIRGLRAVLDRIDAD